MLRGRRVAGKKLKTSFFLKSFVKSCAKPFGNFQAFLFFHEKYTVENMWHRYFCVELKNTN